MKGVYRRGQNTPTKKHLTKRSSGTNGLLLIPRYALRATREIGSAEHLTRERFTKSASRYRVSFEKGRLGSKSCEFLVVTPECIYRGSSPDSACGEHGRTNRQKHGRMTEWHRSLVFIGFRRAQAHQSLCSLISGVKTFPAAAAASTKEAYRSPGFDRFGPASTESARAWPDCWRQSVA